MFFTPPEVAGPWQNQGQNDGSVSENRRKIYGHTRQGAGPVRTVACQLKKEDASVLKKLKSYLGA
jgi:hypothetical protein